MKEIKAEISLEMAVEAQKAYLAQKQGERNVQQQPQAQVGLESGWGGKGR